MEEKPADWDETYHVAISGKQLAAIKFLVDFILKHDSVSLSAIAAADCAGSFVIAVRKQPPMAE